MINKTKPYIRLSKLVSKNKILLTLFLTTFHFPILLAQLENIQLSQITTRDGLGSNIITGILKDSRGFMWFGTQRGLCRYDGYHFTIFQYDGLDTNSLSTNYVRGLHEDKEGNIWVLTEFGLNRFNRKDETFTRFMDITDKKGNIIMSSGHSDKLWIVQWNNKLWQFDMANLKYSPAGLPPSESDSLFQGQITALVEDKRGNLWLCTRRGGIYKYDLSNNKKLVAHYQHNPHDTNSLSDNRAWSLYEDHTGAIWCGTDNGLNQLILNKEGEGSVNFIRYFHDPKNPTSISSNVVHDFAEDGSGILWIRTENGLNTYNRKTGEFNHWEHREVRINSEATYFSMRTLYIDDYGSIWIGIYGDGISRLTPNKNKFRTIQHDPDNTNSVSSNMLYSFLMDTTGVLWVGTRDAGLNKRVPGKNKNDLPTWIHYKNETGNPLSLNSDQIRSIFRDRFGDLWIGTGGGGLNKLVEEKNKKTKFLHFKPDSPGVDRENRVDNICEDQAGTLWIGAGSGLFIFDRKEERFYRYVFDTINPDSININRVNAIGEAPSGAIWISTWEDGLFKVSPPFKKKKNNTVTGATNVSYKYGENTPKGLGDWDILTLCVPENQKNTLVWIGTRGGGLFGLQWAEDPNTVIKEVFINYTTDNGLSDNNIQGIEEDKNGNLWITTSYGLSLFNPETETFINYFEEDGLNTNEFLWSAHYISSRNELFFMNMGIFSFYPDSISQNDMIPPVVITKIRLFNQVLPIGGDSPLKVSPIEAKEITLTHKQNYLSFEFVALNYIKTEQNRYKYKLEGQDLNWVDAGRERSAIYQNLNPGRYVFRVIASNNDGVWNEEGAALKITIKPPWWKTIVAYFIYLLAIGVFIFFYNRYRVNKMEKEKRVLEEKVRERTIQLEENHKELVQQKEELQQTLNYLKETQSQLVQSEKMASIGQLTAGIAHEINNPVNYISAGIDSLTTNVKEIGQILDLYQSITKENFEEKLTLIRAEEEKIDIEETRKEIRNLIKSVTNGAARTTEIVKGLRTFSRLDENEIKPADIHEGIDLTLVMLHNKYKHHVEIIKEFGELPLVECFPGKLNQVFMNILSNAIEAIPEKGTITIKTWEDKPNGRVVISIKDDGMGMSEHTRSNIFNPFFTTKEVGKGTGLGLSISHGIIEQHKGTIEVRSEQGKGSEFIISLPTRQD